MPLPVASLNEGEDRLAFSCLMRLDENGEIRSYKFVKSVICSRVKGVYIDNTLWGGVVGDDGVDGIEIGQETGVSQSYYEFQTYVKQLKSLGIVLTVCSKNDHENAIAGLNHPEGALRPDDFVIIKANWENKDRNIAETAAELNILPDSIVFADDNPAEREIVRTQIKGAAVPDMDGVENYITTIDRSGFFEVTTFSEDDLKRNEMYKKNALRAAEMASFGDYNDYLKSLEMHAVIDDFIPVYRHYHQVSNFGKFLDPLADKLLVLKDGRTEEAREFLSQFDGDLDKIIVEKMYTNNIIINEFLTKKSKDCRQKNIDFVAVVNGELKLIKNVDIFCVLSNLLDNAIEAQTFVDNKRVEVFIDENEDVCSLKIYNSISDDMVKAFKEDTLFKTHKKDKLMHGYGLKNVNDVVKKYNGRINYSIIGTCVLCCSVILYREK